MKFGPGARGRGLRGAGSAVRDACGGRAAALAQSGEWGPAGLTNRESVAERLSSRSGGECCEGAARRRVRRGAGVRQVVVRVGHVFRQTSLISP